MWERARARVRTSGPTTYARSRRWPMGPTARPAGTGGRCCHSSRAHSKRPRRACPRSRRWARQRCTRYCPTGKSVLPTTQSPPPPPPTPKPTVSARPRKRSCAFRAVGGVEAYRRSRQWCRTTRPRSGTCATAAWRSGYSRGCTCPSPPGPQRPWRTWHAPWHRSCRRTTALPGCTLMLVGRSGQSRRQRRRGGARAMCVRVHALTVGPQLRSERQSRVGGLPPVAV
jgi:hypothetical protein